MLICGNRNVKLLSNIENYVDVIGEVNYITVMDSKLSMKVDGDANTINFINS